MERQINLPPDHDSADSLQFTLLIIESSRLYSMQFSLRQLFYQKCEREKKKFQLTVKINLVS